MQLYQKVLENKFFLKILITYCLIIIAGFSFTTYFMTSSMVNNLIETESKYETQIVQKLRDYTEERFKIIDNIFVLLYIQRYHSPNANASITDLIDPYKNIDISDEERKSGIMTTMQNICEANSFISDMMVIDYAKKNLYFTTNELNRDLSLNSNFFNSATFRRIQSGSNSRGIIPNYIPDYIIDHRKFPVITIFINLYDNNFIRDDQKIGAIAINIKPEIFSAAYQNEIGNIKGKLLIMNETGFVFFDSSHQLTGRNLPRRELEFGISGDPLTVKNHNLIVNYLKSESIGLTFMNAVTKQEIYRGVSQIQRKAMNIIIVCIIMAVLISGVASQLFAKRIKNLVNQMKIVEKGRFDTRIQVGSNDEIGYLEKSFNNMCNKLEDYIRTVYLSEIKTKTAELKALQAQINPHFMFNTLESIRMTALINKDQQAAKMIHILGNMFRWNLRMQDMIVGISDELDYLLSYIELQKYRYNSFDVDIRVAHEIRKLGIPKLILQPLVENAIYHGISSKTESGEIKITARRVDHQVEIDVTDNGKGINADKVSDIMKGLHEEGGDKDLYSIGLRNVQQRLKILFGESYGLKIVSAVDRGTTVRIAIPALSKQEMEEYVQSNHR